MGNFHYKVMLFKLKNVGSTNQRMIVKLFKAQIRKNMEAFIDDMVVKSKLARNYLSGLAKIFVILREH